MLLRQRPEGFARDAALALAAFLAASPEDARAWFSLGWACELGGDVEGALRAYQEAAARGARPAALHRAMLLLEVDRVKEAKAELGALARRLRKARGQGALMSARVAFLLGKERQATRAWKRLARKERRRRPLVALLAAVDLATHADNAAARKKAWRAARSLYRTLSRRGGALERVGANALATLDWRDAAQGFDALRRATTREARDAALAQVEDALGKVRSTGLARWEVDAAVLTGAVYLRLARDLERQSCPSGLEMRACRVYLGAVRQEATRLRARVGVYREAALWRAHGHRVVTPTLTRAVGVRARGALPEVFFDLWRQGPQ